MPLLLLLFLFSCAGAPDLPKSRPFHIIANVPFYTQESCQCGPASLAGVLNYWDVPVSPVDIAAAIYSESAKGTLTMDMTWYAIKEGLKAVQYSGSIENIRQNINLKYPVIVMIDSGFGVYCQNHFMVIVGYNEDGILANSGKKQLYFIPFKNFLKLWGKTKFLTILITPEL